MEQGPKEEARGQDGVWEDAIPTPKTRIQTMMCLKTTSLMAEVVDMAVVTARALQAEVEAEVLDLAEEDGNLNG